MTRRVSTYTRTCEMEEMLERCKRQFTFYAQQHRLKLTPEADAKAEVNEQFATDIQEVLDLEVSGAMDNNE